MQDVVAAAIDAGAQIAFMLAMRHSSRVNGLALPVSLIRDLPGVEAFLADGGPWWFGFHAVLGLAEVIGEGHEAEYLDWFCRSGTKNERALR